MDIYLTNNLINPEVKDYFTRNNLEQKLLVNTPDSDEINIVF